MIIKYSAIKKTHKKNINVKAGMRGGGMMFVKIITLLVMVDYNNRI